MRWWPFRKKNRVYKKPLVKEWILEEGPYGEREKLSWGIKNQRAVGLACPMCGFIYRRGTSDFKAKLRNCNGCKWVEDPHSHVRCPNPKCKCKFILMPKDKKAVERARRPYDVIPEGESGRLSYPKENNENSK